MHNSIDKDDNQLLELSHMFAKTCVKRKSIPLSVKRKLIKNSELDNLVYSVSQISIKKNHLKRLSTIKTINAKKHAKITDIECTDSLYDYKVQDYHLEYNTIVSESPVYTTLENECGERIFTTPAHYPIKYLHIRECFKSYGIGISTTTIRQLYKYLLKPIFAVARQKAIDLNESHIEEYHIPILFPFFNDLVMSNSKYLDDGDSFRILKIITKPLHFGNVFFSIDALIKTRDMLEALLITVITTVNLQNKAEPEITEIVLKAIVLFGITFPKS